MFNRFLNKPFPCSFLCVNDNTQIIIIERENNRFGNNTKLASMAAVLFSCRLSIWYEWSENVCKALCSAQCCPCASSWRGADHMLNTSTDTLDSCLNPLALAQALPVHQLSSVRWPHIWASCTELESPDITWSCLMEADQGWSQNDVKSLADHWPSAASHVPTLDV